MSHLKGQGCSLEPNLWLLQSALAVFLPHGALFNVYAKELPFCLASTSALLNSAPADSVFLYLPIISTVVVLAPVFFRRSQHRRVLRHSEGTSAGTYGSQQQDENGGNPGQRRVSPNLPLSAENLGELLQSNTPELLRKPAASAVSPHTHLSYALASHTLGWSLERQC